MGTMRQQLTGADSPTTQHPAFGSGPARDSQVAAILQRTVELDVIPRLLLARREEIAVALPPSAMTPAHIGKLVALLLSRDEQASLAYVHKVHAGGVPAEAIYLDLLAPAARQLGQCWVDDDCDFTDVTVGLFQLQRAMHELGAAFGSDVAAKADALRVLLLPMPQAQHTFGLSMVSEFFRRAGWTAWTGPLDSEGELAAMVGVSRFDAVGFSLGCDEQLDQARRVIALVRKHSRNPDVVVLAGGPGFIDNPGQAVSIGADGTASDGLLAVRRAEALVAAAVARRRS